jgi:predicted DNA-binding protein
MVMIMNAPAVRAEAHAASDVETIVTVRMPVELRQRLETLAEASERSLAQEIRHRLRSGLMEEPA